MSSAVISTSAASGRPFLFDAETVPETGSVPTNSPILEYSKAHAGSAVLDGMEHGPKACWRHLQSAINQQRIPPASITPASRLEIRPALEMVSSGVPAIDALTGGLPRGCLTEICGSASSGRTTVLLAALASATCRGEFCALVDASDALDPQSIATGVDLDRLLWVRCGENLTSKNNSREIPRQLHSRNDRPAEHRLEQVLRATDLLLESGGFGVIALDLADLPPQTARRIPLTTWFRFRRAVEHKPTILLSVEQQPIAGSCSSLLLQLRPARENLLNFDDPHSQEQLSLCDSILPTHADLLTGFEIKAELALSRLNRKPAYSVMFPTRTAWAG
ncbi:MAG TPA: hypothetical protein VMG31_02790 [Verrucomicrobiae bacterium]|nr:hypothetical protein [Verrucomicrobiae bacterium]